jgi:hypothetical protein
MSRDTFVCRSRLDASPEEVFRRHARPGAFARSDPPWGPVEVVERSGSIADGDPRPGRAVPPPPGGRAPRLPARPAVPRRAGRCRGWETAAEPARQKGVRIVHLRFGVILVVRPH